MAAMCASSSIRTGAQQRPGCSATCNPIQGQGTPLTSDPTFNTAQSGAGGHSCALDCSREQERERENSPPEACQPTTMDVKLLALMAVLAVATHAPTSNAKPISLVERCWCRSTLNTVPQRSIKELKFLHTPNCPFQVIAKLKNNREVCINPETKWLQQYLKNAINKVKKSRRRNNKKD
ncbi:hypothetical protein Q8A73_003579 [Channa argus]|nr:hypothetical protein Q8A73_003579 [Channa argus]